MAMLTNGFNHSLNSTEGDTPCTAPGKARTILLVRIGYKQWQEPVMAMFNLLAAAWEVALHAMTKRDMPGQLISLKRSGLVQ